MFVFGLKEHMRECLEARKETNRRIDEINTKMESGFSEARRKIDERHEQNQQSFERLYRSLWKIALGILGALALNYLAEHGFTTPRALISSEIQHKLEDR